MVARHSTYKKQSRWDKATPLSKTVSSYQRKVNIISNKLKRMELIAKARKMILDKHGEAFQKLVIEGKVSKEYLKPYLPRYHDILRDLTGDSRRRLVPRTVASGSIIGESSPEDKGASQ